MVITNWRQAAPTIVHQYGIDYKLLKGQADFSPDVPNYCMRGMLYVAYAMLQTGKSYEAHAHGDHEEVYYIIAGHGTMTINGERQSIRDGDAIFGGGYPLHLKHRGRIFGVFSLCCPGSRG